MNDYPSVNILNAAEHLCDKTKCYEMLNGKILYRDNDHLSLEGGKLISKELIKLLNLNWKRDLLIFKIIFNFWTNKI